MTDLCSPRGGQSALADNASASGFRRLIIILLPLLTPVLSMSDLGGKEANLSAGDFVLLLAVPWMVRALLGDGLRLPLAALCCASVVVTVLSMLSNTGITLSGKGPLGMVVEVVKLLLLWVYLYVTVNLVKSRADLLLMVKAWILGSGLVGLSGIIGSLAFQMTGAHNPFAMHFRAHGTMGDANFFSMHLAVSFFLSVFYLLLTGRRSYWILAVMGVQLAGIVFSASRGGILSVGVSLGALLVFCTPARIKVAALSALALAGLLFVLWPGKDALLASNPYTSRLTRTTVDLNNPEASDRKTLWVGAWQGFLQSPILGVGPGNSVSYHPRKAAHDEAHNTCLGILCETGVMGLAVYLAAFLYFPIKLLSGNKVACPDQLVRAGRFLAIGFLDIGIAGITCNVDNYRGLWMLMAVAYCYRLLYLSGPARSPGAGNRCAAELQFESSGAPV